MADDIFCRIVAGEIPAYKVYEDENFLAFLEINPIRLGHTLLIPKIHYGTIYDMPEKLFAEYTEMARKLAPAIKLATKADKIGLVVAGFHLDHAHLHLLPMNVISDLDFNNQHKEADEKLAAMAKSISLGI
jgi:histidine triad (HIT) family protein